MNMSKKHKRKVSRKRNEQNTRNRERGAGTGGGFIDWKKFDETPKFFSMKEGVNKFNIVPFEVKSKKHPDVKRGEIERNRNRRAGYFS
jgi:hypothetical protein